MKGSCQRRKKKPIWEGKRDLRKMQGESWKKKVEGVDKEQSPITGTPYGARNE
jgi:hypothetical protein